MNELKKAYQLVVKDLFSKLVKAQGGEGNERDQEAKRCADQK